MKLVKYLSTAALALLLGTTTSVYAQKGQEQKGGGEQKPQQAQHAQQPQRTQQAQHTQQPQRAQQARQTQQPQRTQQARQTQQPQRTQQARQTQQPQRTQQARQTQQPQRTQQARQTQQPQRTQQAQRTQQPQQTQQARQPQQPQRTQQAQQGQRRPQGQLSAGRIPDARFRSNFGRGHQFHMIRPVYYGGYSQFNYSGYWFDLDDSWPSDWHYGDDVYVDYYGNVYYLCNSRYPSIRLRISIAI